MEKPSLKSVIAARAPELHAIAGVVGVAESTDNGEPCILVFLSRDGRDVREKVMSVLSGHAVRIIVTGEATLRD